MIRLLLILLALVSLSQPARAQVAGTSCTVNGATAAPDANGNNLRCVAGTWTVMSSGGGTPAGISGAVQFTNGTAFTADASQLFWDNTTKRLGIGGSNPQSALHVMSGAIVASGGYGTGFNGLTIGGGGTSPNYASIAFGDGTGWRLNFGTMISSTFTPRVTFLDSGNVGIGTTSPSVALDVAGAIVSRAVNAGSSTSINWSSGNTQYTSASCGAFTFTNMQDGGTYALAVQGTTSGTCSFAQTGLTFRMPPGHGASTASTHTYYSFNRMGSTVYVSWIKGI